ncbi:MAG: S-methyl-5-thioribose-1-phosphate isomerase [Clostridiales bacterium]
MKTLEFKNNKLFLLNQKKLPLTKEYIECKNYIEVGNAITDMYVRGAPAIGVTAAYGIVLGANSINTRKSEDFFKELDKVCDFLKKTRPTAVNLFDSIDRLYKIADSNKAHPISDIKNKLLYEAQLIEKEDISSNHQIGNFGNNLINKNQKILTHCNAGSLATCGFGTALGIIRAAHNSGKNIHVYADETRPYLQGARLTTLELKEDGIPVTLICDNMAGYFMKEGLIDCVIVGADRIALNGDTANKIGTYSLSVLAKEHNIPFFVAAPTTTIDLSLINGSQIPIEERNPTEISHFNDIQICPDGINIRNPSFDITPNTNITAIITNKGIIHNPTKENMLKLIQD